MSISSVHRRLLLSVILLLSIFVHYVSTKCEKKNFVIGLLSPNDGVSPLQKTFNDNSKDQYNEVMECFNTPSIVSLKVDADLNIPTSGWTNIKSGIRTELADQANTKRKHGLSVVIGPFYQSLAMILEELEIPYIVTDYMGFDWSDISRVNDNIQWKNMLEVRPPMREFNGAIVDFLVYQKWESAVMIMPEYPKDNQECQHLARQMVEHNISPISYTLKLDKTSRMRDSAGEVLRNVQLLQQKKIIICSPREEKYKLIQLVLAEAALFGFIEDETYSFFILDPFTQLDAFSEINMYRRDLFAAKCDLFAYRYTDIDNSTQTFNTGYAFGAADAARIINDAKLYYLQDKDNKNNATFSKTGFLKALKQVRIASGATGYIQFNENGTRTGYTLSLYNHGGKELYNKVATWSHISEQEMADTNDTMASLLFENRNETDVIETRGIFKDVEKIVVVIEEPFVMTRTPPKGVVFKGNDQYEGFTIDLLNRISQDLNFKYEIVLSPGNEYGAPKNKRGNGDANWGGIVGEILARNATLGMGAISITSQRQAVIDFSLGVISTGVNILVSRPKEKFNMFQFLTPFSIELWMAIIGSSFGVCVIYFILDFRSTQRVFTVKSTLWFSLGTLLMKGSDFSPKRTSQRILTTGFLFFVLITVSTYTANMAAFLTKKNLEEPIDSFEELAERDSYNVYTVQNSATMNFLKNSAENSVYNRIWKKIERRNGLVHTAADGRYHVENETAAFIFDSMINSYSEKRYCKTQSVSAPILLQEHGIAMYNGAAFKSQLNIELLRLKEEGFIQSLKKKWWENTRECEMGGLESRKSGQVEFDLQHIAGVFIVGCFGLGAALLMFLVKKAFVLIKRDNPLPSIRRDDGSDASSTAKNHEEKLIFGNAEGKQSTV